MVSWACSGQLNSGTAIQKKYHLTSSLRKVLDGLALADVMESKTMLGLDDVILSSPFYEAQFFSSSDQVHQILFLWPQNLIFPEGKIFPLASN